MSIDPIERNNMRYIHRNGYDFKIDPERPFLRFLGGGSPKKTVLPPAPDPIPTPEDIDLQAMEKGDAERRRIRARRGRESTILTESNNLGGKSTILGTVEA